MDQNDINLIKEVVIEAVKTQLVDTNNRIDNLQMQFTSMNISVEDIKEQLIHTNTKVDSMQVELTNTNVSIKSMNERLVKVELTMATKKDVNDLREEMRFGFVENRRYVSDMLRDNTKIIIESTCSKTEFENLKVHVEVLEDKVEKLKPVRNSRPGLLYFIKKGLNKSVHL